MPDAKGRFKGISVPSDAWDRIFGQPQSCETEPESETLPTPLEPIGTSEGLSIRPGGFFSQRLKATAPHARACVRGRNGVVLKNHYQGSSSHSPSGDSSSVVVQGTYARGADLESPS